MKMEGVVSVQRRGLYEDDLRAHGEHEHALSVAAVEIHSKSNTHGRLGLVSAAQYSARISDSVELGCKSPAELSNVLFFLKSLHNPMSSCLLCETALRFCDLGYWGILDATAKGRPSSPCAARLSLTVSVLVVSFLHALVICGIFSPICC